MTVSSTSSGNTAPTLVQSIVSPPGGMPVFEIVAQPTTRHNEIDALTQKFKTTLQVSEQPKR